MADSIYTLEEEVTRIFLYSVASSDALTAAAVVYAALLVRTRMQKYSPGNKTHFSKIEVAFVGSGLLFTSPRHFIQTFADPATHR